MSHGLFRKIRQTLYIMMLKRDILLYLEHTWNRYVLCFEQWKIKKDIYNNEKQV